MNAPSLPDAVLWVPRGVSEPLPPPMSTSERLLAERLIRAEARAARLEEALRWAKSDLPTTLQDLIDGLLA